ncbi:hypothetical protein NL676_001405 [Syzygium grande]|nr:hypothetical protein NL676_001405 [Syzygium grande]
MASSARKGGVSLPDKRNPKSGGGGGGGDGAGSGIVSRIAESQIVARGEAGGGRRGVRDEEAPEEHGEGRLDRRHHLPRPRRAPHHRDGPRAAAQRARAPTGQPPRHSPRRAEMKEPR